MSSAGVGGEIRSRWLKGLRPNALSPLARAVQEFSGLGAAIVSQVAELVITGTVYGQGATIRAMDGHMVIMRLDASSWPSDGTKTLTFGLERSIDGGSQWLQMASGTTESGSLANGSVLPFVASNIASDEFVRPFITATNASLTVGCTVIGAQ